MLAQKGQPLTVKFKFRHKNGEYLVVRASCYSFQNPYTDEPEYIICTHSPVRLVSSLIIFQTADFITA